MMQWWTDFFHSRTDQQACIVAGYMRIAFGLLILCDRLLVSLDLGDFLDLLPYGATSKDDEIASAITLFQLSPDSKWLYWVLHVISMIHATLLIAGVSPRFQLVCLHCITVSFHHHNNLLWEGEDVMFRMWTFLLLFLPLDHVTLWRQQAELSSSWPMWPFRLWQIELCFIYAGAGLGKLTNERWRNGTAMYHISHTTDFFGGPFTPDLLFNRLGPLYLLTYTSLILECCSSLSIWPMRTRMYTLVSMVLFHIGIDLAMNMHCFEWLSILGWMVFLVKKKEGSEKSDSGYGSKGGRRLATNLFLVVVLAVFLVDTAPLEQLEALVPSSTTLSQLVTARQRVVDAVLEPLLHPLGLHQGVWNMFSAAPNQVFQYEVKYHNDSSSWLSPDWSEMAWYDKKRWQRLMTLYDRLDAAPIEVWDVFVRSKMNNDSSADASSLLLHTYTPPDPPPALGWFEPARQKLEKTTEVLYTLNVCADLSNQCEDLAAEQHCGDWRFLPYMLDNCRRSCNLCIDVEELLVDTRIAIQWPSDGGFYEATVKDIRRNPKRFRLEYDVYDFDDEQYEWMDLYSFRQRRFVVLSSGGDVENGEADEDDSRHINGEL